MTGVLTSLLEWVLSKLPALFSRWYWTEEKLSKGIKFDVRPRIASIEVWFCSRNQLEVYLELENRNTIPIVIDRILGDFTFESKAGPIPMHFLERRKLDPNQEDKYIVLSAQLPLHDKRSLSLAFKDTSWSPRAFLKYRMEVDTKVRSFTKEGTLEGISHFRPINNPDNIGDIT